MIDTLYVKDYVLFDKTNIEFEPGMTVITGETGAGKSLLIDAIHLISGQRAQKNCIRADAQKAVLKMCLSNLNEEVKAVLIENDYDVDDELLIQRTITDSSKSSIKINGQPCTLSFVKDLVSKLVDIHSQMDTYQLMNPSIQLELLDRYAKTELLLKQTETAYKKYAKCCSELKKAKEEIYSEEALEFTTAQYDEIVDADIKENELEELTKRIKNISNSQKALEKINESIHCLDRENGILDGLYLLKKSINKEDINLDLDDLYFQLYDLSDSLKNDRETMQRDMDDIDRLKEREYLIKRLYRKHGGNFNSLMAAKQKCIEIIDKIIHRQDLLDKLEKEVLQSRDEYDAIALKLSEQRCNVFDDLANQIEMHCKDLMLENAQFKIERKEKDRASDGIDSIEFMVSMNTGQPFSPLKISASGGELSRLMLALKVVFQSQQGIQTIIFDEIDTGVSGKVAFAMGQKMHMLSKHYQVLCITHLASVAAWADQHIRVKKESDVNSTVTHVEVLDEQDIYEELAVMSSGEVSKASLLASKELKDRVQNG